MDQRITTWINRFELRGIVHLLGFSDAVVIQSRQRDTRREGSSIDPGFGEKAYRGGGIRLVASNMPFERALAASNRARMAD